MRSLGLLTRVAAVVVAALTVACASPPASPAADVPAATEHSFAITNEPSTSPSGTPSPAGTPTELFAVPAQISPRYVELVLTALGQTELSAIRIIAEERAVTDAAAERYRAAYTPEVVGGLLADWAEILAADPGLSVLADEVRAPRSAVEQLLAAAPGCVYVRVARDYAPLMAAPPGPQTFVVQLVADGTAPNVHNPTPWLIAGDLPLDPGSSPPPDPCAA